MSDESLLRNIKNYFFQCEDIFPYMKMTNVQPSLFQLNNCCCSCNSSFFSIISNVTQNIINMFNTTKLEPCASNPCLNGGNCININCINFYNCSCFPGFTGTTCISEIQINFCESNPYLNGATSNNSILEFIYLCNSGFMGTTCLSSINITTAHSTIEISKIGTLSTTKNIN
jgi:hypothetical protein